MNILSFLFEEKKPLIIYWPDSKYEGPSSWEIMSIPLLMQLHNMTLEQVIEKRKEVYMERTERQKKDWEYCNKLNSK